MVLHICDVSRGLGLESCWVLGVTCRSSWSKHIAKHAALQPHGVFAVVSFEIVPQSIAWAGLKLTVILLSQTPKCRDHRDEPPYSASPTSFILIFVFWQGVSCNLGWPWTLYTVGDEFELSMLLLLPPSKYWDYRHAQLALTSYDIRRSSLWKQTLTKIHKALEWV